MLWKSRRMQPTTFSGEVIFYPHFAPRPEISHVLFDFDGTLSLIRQGWPDVMTPMFTEMLPPLEGETEQQRSRLAFEDIMRLNGKQTIYQMIQLAERIRERGGEPEDPLWYKHEYLRRLEEVIQSRIAGLERGDIDRDDLCVFGARTLLDELVRRGFHLYLASGTDEPFVKREVELLGLTEYFGEHIYGAQNDYNTFSKKMVIDRILQINNIDGERLLAFGDGYVEIENTKDVGGLAVAVASDEARNGSGLMDAWKKERLSAVGADIVVPDYRDASVLLDVIAGQADCPAELIRPAVSLERQPLEPLDLTRLRVFPLTERKSLTKVEDILIDPDSVPGGVSSEASSALDRCVSDVRAARERGSAVILMYGAHLLRNGAAPILDRLMEAGWITHLATNGAATIHDWEYSYLGRSTESVRENVATGTFGTWDETGRNLHIALLTGALRAEGYGASLGRFITEDGTTLPTIEQLESLVQAEPQHPLCAARAELLQAMLRHQLPSGRLSVPHPHKQASIVASAFTHGVPLTVHPGIGYDIITCHPMFNGAAIGRAAGRDFQQFAAAVDRLDDGVVISIGSAVMAPQVFEKSLSCVNNLRLQDERPTVSGHAIYVVDIQDGGNWDWTTGEPPKTHPAYYLRFCKSFSRMGAAMHYVQSDNAAFIHTLFERLAK